MMLGLKSTERYLCSEESFSGIVTILDRVDNNARAYKVAELEGIFHPYAPVYALIRDQLPMFLTVSRMEFSTTIKALSMSGGHDAILQPILELYRFRFGEVAYARFSSLVSKISGATIEALSFEITVLQEANKRLHALVDRLA
jgi:hypothetical protein